MFAMGDAPMASSPAASAPVHCSDDVLAGIVKLLAPLPQLAACVAYSPHEPTIRNQPV